MKRWEKALMVVGAVIAAMLGILTWVDRQFPAEVRMAPVVEASEPEGTGPEPMSEEPVDIPLETNAGDIAGEAVAPVDPPELGEPVVPDTPAEPVDPNVSDVPEVPDFPEPTVPEELPPPPPPTDP